MTPGDSRRPRHIGKDSRRSTPPRKEIQPRFKAIGKLRIAGKEVPLPATEDPDAYPLRFANYAILGLIGVGALGSVYRARGGKDPSRQVAIKVIRSKLSGEGTGTMAIRQDPFHQELQSARLMRHPNVLRVLDHGMFAGHPYIVMDPVVPPRTLREVIKAGPVRPERAAQLIHDCASGLAHIHRHGVVHRDIKPENILIDPEGNIRISDFGIAYLDREASRQEDKDILGSPYYMSPEQMRKETVTHRSDLFSLGIIFYELLSGKHPFGGRDMQSVVSNILNRNPKSLCERIPGLSTEIQAMVERCLAKKPKKRHHSCQAVADQLYQLFPRTIRRETDPIVSELRKSMLDMDFFEDFTKKEINRLAENVIYQKYEEGECIVREGQENLAFYLVARGRVEVSRRQCTIDVLKQGSCFGEIGYLIKSKRTATVTAMVPDTTVLSLNATQVDLLPKGTQLKITKAFIRVLATRLRETTNALSVYLDA